MRTLENSRQTVERFLTHLGEPVGEDQTERAVANVLDRMRTEYVPNPARVLTMPSVSGPARMPIWSTVAAACGAECSRQFVARRHDFRGRRAGRFKFAD